MDVQCAQCGEPWDIHHLRHDLPAEVNYTTDPDDTTQPQAYLGDKPNPAMLDRLAAEGWTFASGRLYAVLTCPCCADSEPLPDAKDRAGDRRVLADVFGEDEDGLAAMLEDLDACPTT